MSAGSSGFRRIRQLCCKTMQCASVEVALDAHVGPTAYTWEAMRSERLALALERVDYKAWSHFEVFAATFLASEFPSLRTLGAPQGDRGRDGILWQPEDDPTVVLQYSVTADWRTKIEDTAKQISSEFPGTRGLVYATSRAIGPAADALKASLREEFGLFLDVRDCSYFVARVNASHQNEAAAEELAVLLVDPLLADKGVVPGKPAILELHEAQTAVVYLALQLEDQSQERGLTKSSFEALVRASLRDTDSSHRLSRSAIHAHVREAIPASDEVGVDLYLDRALERLSRGTIRHWTQGDDFCLSYEEHQRLDQRMTEFAVLEGELRDELSSTVAHLAGTSGIELPADIDLFCSTVRRIIEQVLLARGESFAATVHTGRFRDFTINSVRDLVLKELSTEPSAFGANADLVSVAVETVEATLLSPGPGTRRYLRAFADSYTVMAFLRATPNVQRTLLKMFSHGEIWLDTNVVLPLFAEQLADPEHRRFTSLITAARDAGLSFFVTPGVVEEIERHMNRSIAYTYNQARWEGNIPFLYAAYISAGKNPPEFRAWIQDFRGDSRPEKDVIDAVREEFQIEVRSLEDQEESAPNDVRAAVLEEWYEVHERRRQRVGVVDEGLALRMARHDRENYLGVVQYRNQETSSPLGYTAWWLTLDRAGYYIHDRIAERVPQFSAPPPTLSPDFLLNYLMIGPLRRHLAKGTEASLPLMVDLAVIQAVPADVIAAAEKARSGLESRPDRVVRRLVRDALDAERIRQGAIAAGGAHAVEESIEEALASYADPAHT